jgi:transcriptional regulator with XRE-family HTH domain
MNAANDDLKAEALAAAQAAHAAGLSQQEIAAALGVSQPQVSRILAGKSTRRTRLFEAVCIYAYEAQARVQKGAKPPARSCSTLLDALDAVWDGTDRHAKALALVIRSLGSLKSAPANATRLQTGRPS